ncbi:DUF5819 family protein [Streptomyces celluloflavus]|uniref:DUF5819 family protein n=1 Tax=Streptomyces celluloflavus TaxID=58344 RepID=A0ABW7R7M5_9ACTN
MRELNSGLVEEATATGARSTAQIPGGESVGTSKPSELCRPLRAVIGCAVSLGMAVSFVHVLFLFLHVAPSNSVSQRYGNQINAWVYPLFEQNWRLFAPNPDSINQQISARTMTISADGTPQISGWFDLTALDNAAVRHSVFPSHTAQNMLRRAWTSYLETHGGDDQPRSERARMMQEYLANIATDRVAAHRHSTFENVQLRVISHQIAAPSTADTPRPAMPGRGETRYLPWWKVTHRAH